MPNEEIEAKFLHIDKQAIIAKLESLGAKKQFETLYRRKVFDYPDRRLDKNHSWIRLRDEGDQITLTYKHRLGVTDGPGGHNDAGMEELEVIVSDFDTTAEIMLKTGLELKHYVENKRIRYLLDNIEIDIDEWPLLEPYLEIEAQTWDQIDQAATALGFNPADKVICSTNQIYHRVGLSVNDYAVITFNQQIKHDADS